MRKKFEAQLTLGCIPINKVIIPTKMKGALSNLLACLQYIYIRPKWNKKIFELLTDHIISDKKQTGRMGMSLWEIFVLAQVKLCMNMSYDQLHYSANFDSLLRGILGVQTTDFSPGKEYEYQNIFDNVSLLDESVLKKINDIIVQVGHEVFKKKGQTPLCLKTDSYVVESETHFPTDYNLLYDSGRKCVETIEKLELKGWRKSKNWLKRLKGLMRRLGRVCTKGGPNKSCRVKQTAESYLELSKTLSKKIEESKCYKSKTIKEQYYVEELEYYHGMLTKHIDLLERRLIKEEKIDHSEKVFSIHQPEVELIKKGKTRPNIEIGKKLAITTDQYNLIVDWHIAEKETDFELAIPIVERLLRKHEIKSISFDRGFYSKKIKSHYWKI